MKKYTDLTAEQQAEAVHDALSNVLEDVVSGALCFADELNGDDVQQRIDAALKEADRLQTPWFAGEVVMEDSSVAAVLRGLAQADAEDEDTYYLEAGERVVRLKEER
jgi:hypothetical protein